VLCQTVVLQLVHTVLSVYDVCSDVCNYFLVYVGGVKGPRVRSSRKVSNASAWFNGPLSFRRTRLRDIVIVTPALSGKRLWMWPLSAYVDGGYPPHATPKTLSGADVLKGLKADRRLPVVAKLRRGNVGRNYNVRCVRVVCPGRVLVT